MSQFVRKLESGELRFRFSKHNFYGKVLETFLDLGFIGSFDSYDRTRRRTVVAYRAITQPIPSHRPDNPSFWRVTYEVCRWWNELMFT